MLHFFELPFLYNRFNSKGEVSSYFGTERTNIANSVCVVGCVSQPNDNGCNLIRKVQTRIDSQQYVSFLQEIIGSYPMVDQINIVHNKY